MDPEAFTSSFFKWDPRGVVAPVPAPAIMLQQQQQPHVTAGMVGGYGLRPPPPPPPPPGKELGGIEELFQAYGIRYYTAARISELGFTVSTLVGMKDEELEEMMNTVSQVFRWELLVGERYGIKAALRAERRRLHEEEESRRRQCDTVNGLDALSQEGLSEDPVVQQEREAAGSGGGTMGWEMVKKQSRRRKKTEMDGGGGDEDGEDEGVYERQREHPFIVTEPGEVARGKKNGLDYLFHLYEQCREFLNQVQNIAKERGEKCPTKVTNQVFRYAKKAGASYINKPKMRHYVHCYALHCLDEEVSNALRRSFKDRGENVGTWRQACYKPLVAIAARHGSWDIDAIFNSHPRLAIWYVPTKLRQLCCAERNASAAAAVTSSMSSAAGPEHLLF